MHRFASARRGSLVYSITLIFCAFLGFGGAQARAADETPGFSIRWTGADDPNADFTHVVDSLNAKLNAGLVAGDFLLFEDIDLATAHFKMYWQAAAGLPLKGQSIRIWSEPGSGKAIQVEAELVSKATLNSLSARLTSNRFDARDEFAIQKRLMKAVRATVLSSNEDPHIRSIAQKDEWQGKEPVRVFRVKGKLGEHVVTASLLSLQILSTRYESFPQADANSGELSLPVQVYPIYETARGRLQTRIMAQLKHLKTKIARVKQDPFESLRYRRYLDSLQDPLLGLTSTGQAQGYWSMADLKRRAAKIREGLPLTDNALATGLVLEGLYATVSLDPGAKTFAGSAFQPEISAEFKPNSKDQTDASGNETSETIPSASLLGRPLSSYEDAYERPARKLPDNDPASLLSDGFDEIQVYYAIDTLVDSLHQMGFTDPELSTRPFNAFLYNPDISMRDNAFYTDDTINFTTYSPGGQNMARDNSTIWHELGHGVMDRLMGDALNLNDSGGLSEGMADFVAALVIAKVTNGQPFDGQKDFRIVNNTGFFLTNESHDDGEAYGGAMYDLLNAARAKFGEAGTAKVADLTMEAMRLSRNHPALTAPVWFTHMLFADERGHGALRAPGELHALILSALANRNFAFNSADAASFELTYNGKPVDPKAEGSRNKPVNASLHAADKATYELKLKAKESTAYGFHYPLQVRVTFQSGSLQGPVHWEGEENGDQLYTLHSADEELTIKVTATGKCDSFNREDGSCVDYAYIQLWPEGVKKPVGKKRFYVHVKPVN